MPAHVHVHRSSSQLSTLGAVEEAEPSFDRQVSGSGSSGKTHTKAGGLGYFKKREEADEELIAVKSDEPDFDWTLLEDEPGYEPASCVSQAVCWMKEANLGVCPPYGRDHFRTQRQVEMYRLRERLLPYFTLCNLIFICLGFLEVPPWCHSSGCEDDENIPRLIHNFIPTWLLILLEVFLLLVYAFRIWLNGEIFLQARSKLLTGWRGLGALCIAVSLASLLIVPVFGHFSTTHRLLRMPLFISATKGLRDTLTRIVRSLPAIQNAVTMLVLCTLFFSWMGMVIFSYTPASITYPSLVKSMRHMYVLICTNDMPGIMLTGIEKTPMHGLFYVVFLVLSVFLLMNVLLADMYARYKDFLTEAIIDLYKNRKRSIDMAYGLLQEAEGGDAGIGEVTLAAFLQELIGDGSRAAGVLAILDDDESGLIEGGEFAMVAEVLADPNFTPVSDGGGYEWLKAYEDHIGKFDKFCDKLAGFAAVLVMFNTACSAEAGSIEKGMHSLCYEHSIINSILFIISLAYLSELVLEVASNGKEKFLASDPFQNKFDTFTVCALVPLEIWFFVFGGVGAPVAACRIMTLIRGMRCLRMLHKIPGPRELVVKVYNGMEAFSKVFLLLFCMCYFYCQVGMIFLGGRVSKSNEILLGTDYAGDDFWHLNFNDVPSALLLLFSHLAGNNNNEWTNAFTTAFGNWVWIWFFAFDMLSNFIILNIVVALVIDCVLVKPPEPEKEEEEEEEVPGEDNPDRSAHEDAPTTPGEQEGEGKETWFQMLQNRLGFTDEEGPEWQWPDREDQIRFMFAGSGVPELQELDKDQKQNRDELRELFGAS